MKKLITILMFMAAFPIVNAASGIKPGLWEVQITKQTLDGQDMAADLAAAKLKRQEIIAKMTPEQRQQAEKAMRGQKLTDKGGHQVCVSPEMASQDKPLMSLNEKCPPTNYQHKGNKSTFELNCTSAEGTTVGKGETVVDNEIINSSIEMTMNGSKSSHTVRFETQMKFLSANCQGLKPIEASTRQ